MSLAEITLGMILLLVFDTMMIIAAVIWQNVPDGKGGSGSCINKKDPPWRK